MGLLKYNGCSKGYAFHLLCWPTISKVDVEGMAVEVEHSCQCSAKFCCCVAAEGQFDNGV